MVLKNIQRITDILPDIKHVVMFYDDGTVFQTNFAEPVNVPEIGKNLSESLKHFAVLFETAQMELEYFSKLIYETLNHLVIILRLGEGSNLALFFDKGPEEPNISLIRRYIYRIEDLIDTDKLELDRHALEEKKKEINRLKEEIKLNLEQIEIKKLSVLDLENKVVEIQNQIENKKVDLKSDDLVVERLEGYIDLHKEKLREQRKKEVEKQLKEEIKTDEKGLSMVEKGLVSIEKEIDQLYSDIKKIEDEKESILSEITILLDENKKSQDKISEIEKEIFVEEEKLHQKERLKLERELFMEKLYE